MLIKKLINDTVLKPGLLFESNEYKYVIIKVENNKIYYLLYSSSYKKGFVVHQNLIKIDNQLIKIGHRTPRVIMGYNKHILEKYKNWDDWDKISS